MTANWGRKQSRQDLLLQIGVTAQPNSILEPEETIVESKVRNRLRVNSKLGHDVLCSRIRRITLLILFF